MEKHVFSSKWYDIEIVDQAMTWGKNLLPYIKRADIMEALAMAGSVAQCSSAFSCQACNKLRLHAPYVHSSYGCCLLSTPTKVPRSPSRLIMADRKQWTVVVPRAATSAEGTIAKDGDWGEPISLGTAKLPPGLDLKKLESLLFQWANSLTQNANLPLEIPLKVDKIEGGVRLGYIRISDGVVEDLVHIDALVLPASEGSPQPQFQALRNGKLKSSVPPGEPAIMRSLLQALKTSVKLARAESKVST